MNKTAYLVASISLNTSPPTVKKLGIYSEEYPSMVGEFCIQSLIGQASGKDYEDAQYNLLINLYHMYGENVYQLIKQLDRPPSNTVLQKCIKYIQSRGKN